MKAKHAAYAGNADQGLTRYFPVFVEYVREFFLASVEDGISYLEVRMALWYK